MPKTYCPACDAVVSVDNPRTGGMVTCRECGAKLEIISTSPFEVDFPLEEDEWEWEEEDEWEDEWEDEEDE